MAVKYLSGNRLWGTNAERLAMTTYSATQNSWKLLDREKLDGTATAIDLDFSSDTKQNIMVLIAWARDSGAEDPLLQLGGTSVDTSTSNYANRTNHNNGSDFEADSGDSCNWIFKWGTGTGSTIRNFQVITFSNHADHIKLGESISGFAGATGAGNAPNTLQNTFAYNKTDGQVGYIKYQGDSGGGADTTFSDESEIVVLGCDDSTSASAGDNFWEELGQKTLDEVGDTIDSGTFTTKKYLWFEAWTEGDNTEATFRFNNIATATYATRRNNDGSTGSGNNHINQNQAKCNASGDALAGTYTSGFVYNVADQEKICMTTQIANEATGSGKPRRATSTTKWVETTNPITSVQIFNTSTGDFAIGSRIRVWGHD